MSTNPTDTDPADTDPTDDDLTAAEQAEIAQLDALAEIGDPDADNGGGA